MGLGRLLIVDADRSFAAELKVDGERLGLEVRMVHDPSAFESTLQSWAPTIIAMDLVMPNADGLELIHICGRSRYRGEEIARTNNLNVVATLPKPFRPKQFSYLLMSLL